MVKTPAIDSVTASVSRIQGVVAGIAAAPTPGASLIDDHAIDAGVVAEGP
jgi:hypothetical protein